MQTFNCRRNSAPHEGAEGFSLIELMLVLVVMGILAAVAIPSYQGYVSKGRRSDAVAAVASVQQAQERLRANQPNYAGQLSDLGISATTASGHYAVDLSSADAVGYVVVVTPTPGGLQANDAPCASMKMTMSKGNAIYTATRRDGTANDTECWPK